MEEVDFDFEDTAMAPATEQEFLMENLCTKKGRESGGYEPPATRSASKRWKRIHEQSMMLRLEEMHAIKKQNAQMSKEAAREIIRKIPVEVLAKEWLSKEDATVDMRAYLVDHVLPTLILGVERLLKEVDEKGLSASNRFEPEFNPVNFLAQYLMRNNPRFSNFAEASPYVRGLREVSEEIKQELFTFEDNRLARIKAEARRKRNEREKYEQMLREEKERRQEQLIIQFQEWNVPTDNNRVELSLLQNALRSFAEIAEQLPSELREVAKFGHPLEPTDETGRTLAVKEFAQYISLFVEDLPIEVFDQFMIHMSKCAAAHRAAAERENRRIILTNLFLLCDHGGHFSTNTYRHIKNMETRLGTLDRLRILTLFEQYWDSIKGTADPRGTLRNPRRWPVVEVEEVDDTMFDAWTEESEGGLTEQEAQMSEEQLEQIDIQLQKDINNSVAADKAARDKWKMEQLSEKSEESRQRFYRYNATDFMLLPPYPFTDTIEAPKKKLRIRENVCQQFHDLNSLCLTKNVEERVKLRNRYRLMLKIIRERTGGAEGTEAGAEPSESRMLKESISHTSSTTPHNTQDSVSSLNAIRDREEGSQQSLSRGRSSRHSNKDSSRRSSRRPSRQGSSTQQGSQRQSRQRSNIPRKTSRENTNKNASPVMDQVDQVPRENTTFNRYEDSHGTDSNADQNSGDSDEKYDDDDDDVEEEDEVMREFTRIATDESEMTGEGCSCSYDTSDSSFLSEVERSTSSDTPTSESTSIDYNNNTRRSTESSEDERSTAGHRGQLDRIASAERHRKKKMMRNWNTEWRLMVSQPQVRLQFQQRPIHGVDASTSTERARGSNFSPYQRLPPIRSDSMWRNVDITAELAASQNKSAVKQQDPATQATATGRVSVTFAGNTAFDRERTAWLRRLSMPNDQFARGLDTDFSNNKPELDRNINSCQRVRKLSVTTNSRSQSQMSAFDESILNVSQFVQLVETFLGHHPHYQVFQRLVLFIKQGYQETEEEKTDRLLKARKEAISAKRKVMMDNLFEKWDNDGSGFLEMEEVIELMVKFKDGQESETIMKATNELRKRSRYHDSRLSKREFRLFIELIIQELPGSESFDLFVDFLTNSVERSYAERIRGEARKKWLQQIITASLTSGTSMDPVYKAIFQALYRDAETHGGGKRISASISMLEKNKIDPPRGDLLLRYAACTPEDCQYMLGKTLFKNMKGISFLAVEQGKPIHVPRVANHGNIYFWNYDRRSDDREGSFIAVPLKDRLKRVFGILGIDTLIDPHKKAIFITHEIHFFQGVAKAFSIAYHNVDVRRKLLRITESAISWIQRRCPHIADISMYLVEPGHGQNNSEPVLRKMMTTDKKGSAIHLSEVIRLERKDNLFRDYLFKCMDNSETVVADAYGERHTAFPLRDNIGKAVGVIDVSIGNMKKLPLYENKEAQRMLRLLQQAHREITREAEGDESKRVLEAEEDDNTRMDIMFDRIMLMELRENVSRLDPQSFAELKSYYEPPRIIVDILRATLAVFRVDSVGEGEYEEWNDIKNSINNDLIQQIKSYDPTVAANLIEAERVEKYLKATFSVPHGEVGKYGSIPAQQLYNWVFVCLSLIEHTRTAEVFVKRPR